MTDGVPERHPNASEAWLSELFGPDITPEEELRLLESNDQPRLARLNEVLTSCMSKESVEGTFGIPYQEVARRIQDKELIVIEIEGESWLPSWQFHRKEDGAYDMQPTVSEAWVVWGRGEDTQTFCNMMLWSDEGYELARLDILLGDDEEAIAEVMATFAAHGIRYA